MRGTAEFKLIARLMGYSIKQQPSIVPIAFMGILSSAAELGAVICLIPLGIVASGKPLPGHSLWSRLPHALGLVPDAKFFVLLFLGTWLFRMASNVMALIFNGHVMQSLFAHFAIRAHASFVRHLPFSEIIKYQIGHFFTLAGDEANRGAQIVVGVLRIVPVVVLFATYAAFIFYQSWKAGFALAAIALAIGLVLAGAFRKALQLGQRQQDESRATHTLFFDSLGGLRTVRSFTAEDFVISRYMKLTRDYVRTCFWGEALSYTTHLPFMVLIAAALAAIAIGADNGWLMANMPLFFAGLMMFTRLMPMANYGLDIAMKLTSNLKAGRNVSDMLDAVSQSVKESPHPHFPKEEPVREITFDKVTFRYSPDTPPVLHNFARSLHMGRSYAITGPSGTGKSSLIDLLLKFYQPDAGSILVNGHNIANLSATSLRSRMILAEQATRIFYGSVLENVRFDLEGSRQAAEQALHLVGLDELLATLPEGIDTFLAFQGNNFSGGQRQRIGLARAILRDADVLILDESTNALDFETRRQILDKLLASYRDRILIFVTHDPYVMERVDEVIELRPGEQGAEGKGGRMSLFASAKDHLRNARACLRCVGAIRSALKTHRTNGQFPQRDWSVLLDAHCRTNGRSTDLLRPFLRHMTPARPTREASGLLGQFTVSEQCRIAGKIARDGYYVFDTLLPEDLCDQIQAFAMTTPANVFDEFGAKDEAVRYTPQNLMGRLYKFPESVLLGSHAIQQLMADDAFLRIAESYLRSEVTIGGLDSWWSAPYGHGPSSESAQLFHFDFDAPPNWLKLFAYVTEVGADTGPHIYVRGSHKAGNPRARQIVARGYQRIADNEIEQIYGAGSLIEITGRRGTVFMADTRGFHKGKHPTQGDRLLVQIIYCSPVFLDHGPKPTNVPPFGPQLRHAAGNCPSAYRRYLHG